MKNAPALPPEPTEAAAAPSTAPQGAAQAVVATTAPEAPAAPVNALGLPIDTHHNRGGRYALQPNGERRPIND